MQQKIKMIKQINERVNKGQNYIISKTNKK